MTILELETLINAENLTPEIEQSATITCGYTCDLLSWVMAHGKQGMAWITVQTHINVVAVAVLMEMAVVILPENIMMEEASLAKAKEEGLVVLRSCLSAFSICGLMAANGVPSDA